VTWTKLGDEYTDHCWKLSDAAFRLHTDGLVWSNRRHLDGILQKADMRRWARTPEAVGELLEHGFWADEGTFYRIVYHLGWQRTAEQWLRQSEANKANRAKGRLRPVKPKPAPPSNESSNESSDERDRTGQDRKNAFKGTQKPENANGPAAAHCRYCRTELAAPDRGRGICQSPACQADAKAELS
jgi:hypothetical protein